MVTSSSNDESSSASSPMETLTLFTTLLGTFQLKEEKEEDEASDIHPEQPQDVSPKKCESEKCHSANPTSSATSTTTSLTSNTRNGRLLQLLLTSNNNNNNRNQESNNRNENSVLKVPTPCCSVECSSFSSLSLDHAPSNDPHPTMPRQQAEEHAATLMGRPIYASAYVMDDHHQHPTIGHAIPEEQEEDWPVHNISHIPQVLLQHFLKSFMVLVDARVRAHATFLAHFGQSLQDEQRRMMVGGDDGEEEDAHRLRGCQDEEEDTMKKKITSKMEILSWLGRHLSVDAVVTSFSIMPSSSSSSSSSSMDSINTFEEEDDSTTIPSSSSSSSTLRVMTLPIGLEGVLDLTIPHFHFGVRNTTVTICASGTISGNFEYTHDNDKSPVLRSVHVALDTHELLAAMMEEASHIVSVMVDMTNDACHHAVAASAEAAATVHTMTTPTSYLFFPQLPSSSNKKKKKTKRTRDADEDDHHEAHVVTIVPRHSIVTPDLTCHSFGQRIPSFTLDDQRITNDADDKDAAPDHKGDAVTSPRTATSTSSITSSSEDYNCPLTPERCANIVDFAICDIDDKILVPTKRPRFGLV